MKKIISTIIITIYAIIAIFVTICLLSYNEHKVTQLGSYALVIIDNDELKPEYNKGDLAIVDGSKKIEKGDSIFFYDVNAKDFEVGFGKVEEKQEDREGDTTYTLSGNKKVSSEFVAGSSNNTKKIANVGTILSILASKWGFLILIILPALLAFLYQIIEIITEARKNKNVSDKNANESKES